MEPENANASVVKVKKRRNECEWSDNKRKTLRANGQEYVSKKGKIVSKRTTGKLCR